MMPDLESAELPADAVEVGRIAEAWGIQGWFKIHAYSASPEALFSSKRWYLQASTKNVLQFQGTRKLAISEAKDHSGTVVAKAQEVADRSAAEALRGARIFIPRSSFPSAGQGEYYWVDLMGLAVVNREGIALGQVADLLSTGPQTVLVLTFEVDGTAQERFIPFVAAYVDAVDLAAKRITVDWQAHY
ncbi:MAG: ribosome maturation factor RimM [Burkholderiaceae bacterium]